jgi:hypothetical protein
MVTINSRHVQFARPHHPDGTEIVFGREHSVRVSADHATIEKWLFEACNDPE